MTTGTFTYDAVRAKILKECIKTRRKIIRHSNSTRAMLLVWERLPFNHIFLYAQWTYFGSQGMVVKCTAANIFLTLPVDCLNRESHVTTL